MLRKKNPVLTDYRSADISSVTFIDECPLYIYASRSYCCYRYDDDK